MDAYSLTCTPDELARHLGATVDATLAQPRAKCELAQGLPAVMNETSDEVQLLRWGLIPSWAIPSQQYNLTLAKAETLLEKEAYKVPFKRRRCLVPATGFYIKKRTHHGTACYYYTAASGEPFAMAGVWDKWRTQNNDDVISFSIIVCRANLKVKTSADYMPVILPVDAYPQWLSNELTPDLALLQSLLSPVLDSYLNCTLETPEAVAERLKLPLTYQPALQE